MLSYYPPRLPLLVAITPKLSPQLLKSHRAYNMASDTQIENSDILEENPNGLEIGNGETPTAGGALEEIAEEITPKIDELVDASAEITEQIREAAKNEAEVKKIDEERGDIFDEIEDEIEDALPTKKGFGGVGVALLLLGSIVLYVKHKNKKVDLRSNPIDDQMTKASETTVDKHGMVH